MDVKSFGKGTDRKLPGTYLLASIEIQHPDMRQFGKQFDAFDRMAQYVFRYVSMRLLDMNLALKWQKRMAKCLDDSIAKVSEAHEQLRKRMEQGNVLPAKAGVTQSFTLTIQTSYSSRYRMLLQHVDAYAMLLEAALLRLVVDTDEYRKNILSMREIATGPKNLIYVMGAEAETMLATHLKKQKKSQPEPSDNGQRAA